MGNRFLKTYVFFLCSFIPCFSCILSFAHVPGQDRSKSLKVKNTIHVYRGKIVLEQTWVFEKEMMTIFWKLLELAPEKATEKEVLSRLPKWKEGYKRFTQLALDGEPLEIKNISVSLNSTALQQLKAKKSLNTAAISFKILYPYPVDPGEMVLDMVIPELNAYRIDSVIVLHDTLKAISCNTGEMDGKTKQKISNIAQINGHPPNITLTFSIS